MDRGIGNFSVLSLHKLCPPVMKALIESKEVDLNGIICPGHVSAIIGSNPYEFIPRNFGIACVISGFEPVDILLSIGMIVEQIENGRPQVEIAYRRGVKPEGNEYALNLMDKVFEKGDANWRGIGTIAESGLKIRQDFRQYDALHRFSVDLPPEKEQKGCICGDILRGIKKPFSALYSLRSVPLKIQWDHAWFHLKGAVLLIPSMEVAVEDRIILAHSQKPYPLKPRRLSNLRSKGWKGCLHCR
jgi:hydrogenase expression/formation protein HypD